MIINFILQFYRQENQDVDKLSDAEPRMKQAKGLELKEIFTLRIVWVPVGAWV